MRLAIGTPDLMLRLPGLPTSPNIRYLRRRKSRPLLLTHSNTILKLQVYQMVLHRPIECTPLIGTFLMLLWKRGKLTANKRCAYLFGRWSV